MKTDEAQMKSVYGTAKGGKAWGSRSGVRFLSLKFVFVFGKSFSHLSIGFLLVQSVTVCPRPLNHWSEFSFSLLMLYFLLGSINIFLTARTQSFVNTQNKTNHTRSHRVFKNCARKWCWKLCTFLFQDTLAFGEMCSFFRDTDLHLHCAFKHEWTDHLGWRRHYCYRRQVDSSRWNFNCLILCVKSVKKHRQTTSILVGNSSATWTKSRCCYWYTYIHTKIQYTVCSLYVVDGRRQSVKSAKTGFHQFRRSQ